MTEVKYKDLIMKVDMWYVKSATREDVLSEYNTTMAEDENIIEKNIYSTENYEIFYYKYIGVSDDEVGVEVGIRTYYLYADGKRFALSGYVFGEDKAEYDAIFNRIAESVKFQF